ncbi:sigma-70 family RNA polymerase sigma factor [Parapedobacter sp. ISTM3]|uniref:RNA polymerase sigma-70 factor, ECF subfamily n=1 Tax=Parapedobacter luteus TaxID=623280 RepID=A0A1T5BPW0_9SPHI|nr:MULTISPECIES: sigma-70 family RNA polymerase sigma factor [Parapedobacter]MBK1439354.1 sigma-70 family RNA polymerase sigma factor [Parapedobacter sp. ISTM3]SKB49258.1 RNA polymerase sigma-70 factor, ECF subfamily [Parapedobacter luteus]
MSFEQFKSGDERILSAYFDRYARGLLLFAYRMVGDDSIAEELVQDAFLKLWEARERLESEAHLKSFLYLTTRNACIDYLKGIGNRLRAASGELKEELLQADSDLLARMIHAETLQLIYAAIKRLSPTQQRVFKLTFIDGLSTEEIGAELGMNSNAVFIARSKALARLQKLFKGKDLLIYVAFLSLANRQFELSCS